MSVNRVFLLGHLGADPELRYTQSQNPVCTLRLATNERRRSAEGEWSDHTEWHTVTAFGKTAENCNQFLKKGRMAFVEGRISTRKYQDQEGKDRYFTEIIANNVQFVGGAGRGESMGMEVERVAPSGGGRGAGAAAAAAGSASLNDPISFDDDDIPF